MSEVENVLKQLEKVRESGRQNLPLFDGWRGLRQTSGASSRRMCQQPVARRSRLAPGPRFVTELRAMSPLSTEAVLEVLRTVNDPDLRRDLVSLGMIRDLEVSGGRVSFRVVLTTPACPMKKQMEDECRSKVAAIVGVKEVRVRMDAEVRRPRPEGSAQGSQPDRKSTRLNSSHVSESRMPSSA